MVRDNSEDKAERILSIYTKLTQGKVINKAQQSHLYVCRNEPYKET